MTQQELLEVRKAWQRDAARLYERARTEYRWATGGLDDVYGDAMGTISYTITLQRSASIYFKTATQMGEKCDR